jgi:hypothetical protein
VDGRRRNSGGRRIARGWNQADADQFQTMNALFAEYFPSSPPTRATPIVNLPGGLLISIEAVAVRT